MEVTLIESIDNHAAKEHSNRSAMIAHACRYYLEREATK
jgi:metal-responsive CopG/Arc/MetJ family transcriptional regulator